MSIRAAIAPFQRIARLTLVLAGLVAALVALPPAALAQDGPSVPTSIAPLRVDSDPNGVNRATGKMNIDVPTLSVPASPRLRFDRVQNDTDPDGDYPLTVIAASGPNAGGIVGTTSIMVVSDTQTGTFVNSYTVRDSRGATANGTVTVAVSGGFCF